MQKKVRLPLGGRAQVAEGGGRGSPFFVFFTFGVGTLALPAGFRRIVMATAISMALYLGLSAACYPDRRVTRGSLGDHVG
jgi:hypothetical protein